MNKSNGIKFGKCKLTNKSNGFKFGIDENTQWN